MCLYSKTILLLLMVVTDAIVNTHIVGPHVNPAMRQPVL